MSGCPSLQVSTALGSVQELRQHFFPDFGPSIPFTSELSAQALIPHPPQFADVILNQKMSCLMVYMFISIPGNLQQF